MLQLTWLALYCLVLGRITRAQNSANTLNALVGSAASFHGYLNEEFNQIVVELSARHKWQYLTSNTHVRSPKPPDVQARDNAVWSNIASQAITLHGRAPRTLLFLLKFHWDYEILANIGSHVAHDLPKTTM